MIKIGNKKISTNVFLAPMAGCTDLPFRLIAREFGAGFCFLEMVDANSIIHRKSRLDDYLQSTRQDRPLAAQIIGGDLKIMLKAAKILVAKTKPAFLDLNAGCPVPKMTKKKAGAHLVREPELLYAILNELVGGLDLPVTVKMRLGFGSIDRKQIVKVARGCVKAGVAALFVHGRSRDQGYSGEIDYGTIKAIKEAVAVPVFGSGNIFNAVKAAEMFSKTGCDGVLVARGALGNPWIFQAIARQKDEIVPKEEKIAVLQKHLQLIDKYKRVSERVKIGLMRKTALWYLKGFANSAGLRGQVTTVQSYREMLSFLAGI
ncbi:tRNA dihydrouridine synthase DusB [candidate division WOR-1 bacterium RIFOXYB2_FULL_48_7]|uniref:tRNA-dihydrouridine synthase n=1 Tax=candidate division WOR-1 bacterium RIFOXYB2_FULL_48_7 TaxID=1802583 RepID=A0A1F4TKZ0_UNCSA|nr:MAG: tRNA dihydrouridine synthase DusB [candidate division WOR-1 bacterium RIFOXYB2_FULL_48_7]